MSIFFRHIRRVSCDSNVWISTGDFYGNLYGLGRVECVRHHNRSSDPSFFESIFCDKHSHSGTSLELLGGDCSEAHIHLDNNSESIATAVTSSII
jgi:hypothetical protein